MLELVSFQMTSLNGRIVAMVTLERLVSKVIANICRIKYDYLERDHF